MCIRDSFMTISEFNDILDNANLVTLSNNIIAELMNVQGGIRDLTLMNIGVYNTSYPSEADIRSSIALSLNEVQNTQRTLQLSSMDIFDEHSRLLNTKSVPIYILQGGTITSQEFTLYEATQQIISKAFNVRNANLSNITWTNSDVHFVEYNLFNDFYTALRKSSDYYVLELVNRSTQKKNVFLILLIVSAVALVLTVIVLFPVLHSVNKTKEEVLSLFLDIPEKTVKGLYTRCENFISTLQVGEDEDMMSDVDDESFEKGGHGADADEDSASEYQPRKKRKKFKNSGKSQRRFYLNFFAVIVFVEGYFIINYNSSQGLLSNVKQLVTELNTTSMAEGFSAFVNNVERQLIIDPKFPVLGTTSLSVATANIQNIYTLDSTIHQEHSINVQIHSDLYKNTFNQIMMLNPCYVFLANISNDQCIAFADSAVYQGMAVGLTRHFENLRYLLTQYTTYSADARANFTGPRDNFRTITTDNQRNNILNILRLPQAFEISSMQALYIKLAFRALLNDFRRGLNDDFNAKLTLRLALYIVLNIALILLYFVAWLPIVSRLNKNIWRTKSMLTMIPLNVVAKIRSVRVYLRKFISEKNITNY
eukprot:TRINITY_DN2823_c0_g1_i4.p1 TRINITY_DN2823_c0_g1~~TRINITY_DN2823_c0_g1_i4.p1  ORF type:complete len:594 (-),score=139.09 TRINITY_DN2823_c0_g1_i4:141-1922(-)